MNFLTYSHFIMVDDSSLDLKHQVRPQWHIHVAHILKIPFNQGLQVIGFGRSINIVQYFME